MIPIKDTRPGSAAALYTHVAQTFQTGSLLTSQQEAAEGAWQFQLSNPDWAARFELLEAEIMVQRGMYDDALRLLAGFRASPNHPNEIIRESAIEADALTHQHLLSAANDRLSRADILCKSGNYMACGYLLRIRGLLAVRQGKASSARQYFLGSLFFARAHRDRWLEVSALNDLGFAAMQAGHFDEAVDWLQSARRDAVALDSAYWTQLAVGNLGWADYQLGNDENALDLFLQAEKTAARIQDTRFELKWITTAGYIYRDTGNLDRAAQSYRHALYLAKQIDSKEDVANAMEDLADVSISSGKLDDARAYLDQATTMENAGGNLLSSNIMLTQGELAAARHQDQLAKTLFRAIRSNPEDSTTIRLDAGDDLASLYETEGKTQEAEREYRAALIAFETARSQLTNDTSRLPFGANARKIYDDYIHLLVRQGRSEEALAVADQSRARTLAQGLGVAEHGALFHPATLNPRAIARKAGATLLFYWLGDTQSYLWAITPAKITLVNLPPQAQIVARVERYRDALLDMDDPLQDRDEDGQALYRMLVAPAAKLLRRNRPVVILSDGALSKLNFETLLVPGPGPQDGHASASVAPLHYLIDDATLVSAPSLAMIADARPERFQKRNLLLLGNPVSPSPDYPSLPLFGTEMTRVASHFAPGRATVFAGRQATPEAYLRSDPARYAYIHFVAHATASQTDPLDSAIILSRGKTDEAPFKLYAREIMKHPLDARLVTLSACYGSGTRSYAGEGLVGLSWAFLRAGAHSVIGALWEVSDASTPRLMNALYQRMEDGQPPAVALRNAKLSLLHGTGRFRLPFYWAPFQIYTRQ